MSEDIRWVQRFDNFQRSLKQLDKAVALLQVRELNELEKQGIIQTFKYNYELAWNVLKDFYEFQGVQEIHGCRDAIKVSFKRGLIYNGDVWMKMIKSRSLTVKAYNDDIALEILEGIIHHYHPEFLALKARLTEYLEPS